MPDWCQNHLVIEGDEDALTSLRIETEGVDREGQVVPLSFAQILPPADATPRTNIDTWGTKWAPSADEFYVDERSGSQWKLIFATPATPPLLVIEHLAERYPALRFKHAFYEPTWELYGERTWQDGKLYAQDDLDTASDLEEQIAFYSGRWPELAEDLKDDLEEALLADDDLDSGEF